MARRRLVLYRERLAFICRCAYAAVSILSGSTELWGTKLCADPITIAELTDQPWSTGAFYALCKFNSERCEGYLTGVADILLAMGNSHIAGGICNAEYDSANLRKVFELWVERPPDHLRDAVAISAQAAFPDLWP